MRARLATAMAAGAAIVLTASISGATTGPGTAAQISADVTASVKITTLPTNLSPSLSTAARDTAYVDTPSLAACNTNGANLKLSKCVFGDTKGTKTMVLWGDSHAFMWFPAVNAAAKAAKWKLVAVMKYGCPVADVSVWNPLTKTPYTVCDTFRTNMIAAINKLNPSLVLLTEAFTSQAASGGGANNTISYAQWQAALTKTLQLLHSKKMKKLVIGSTVASASPSLTDPAACLASNPMAVQKCTIDDTVPQQTERAAEVAAAKATSTTYLNTLPWLCDSSVTPTQCSAVIGDKTAGYKVVYYSTGHLTETYSLFLSAVLEAALKPHM